MCRTNDPCIFKLRRSDIKTILTKPLRNISESLSADDFKSVGLCGCLGLLPPYTPERLLKRSGERLVRPSIILLSHKNILSDVRCIRALPLSHLFDPICRLEAGATQNVLK